MDNENDQLFSCYRKLYNLREDGKMTLAQLRDVIAGPKLKLKTLEIRRLDAAGEVDKTRKKKLSLPTFAVSFLFPDERYNDQAAEPTGYVLVDIDHLSGPVAGYFEQCKSLPFLALAYVSARGKGLHLICRAETDAATHADVCRALYDLLEATFGEPVDRNCTDLTRTSLLCWDAGCYYSRQTVPNRHRLSAAFRSRPPCALPRPGGCTRQLAERTAAHATRQPGLFAQPGGVRPTFGGAGLHQPLCATRFRRPRDRPCDRLGLHEVASRTRREPPRIHPARATP